MQIDQGALEHIRTVLTDAVTHGGIDDKTLHDALVYGLNHSYDGTNVHHIEDADDLERFRRTHGVRSDWHEPDEQDVTATVIGHNLDTSSTHVDDVYDHDRSHDNLTVVLHEQAIDENNIVTGPGKPLAYVNLAQLLSWACNFELED